MSHRIKFFGWIESDYIYIHTVSFTKAMTELGFSEKSIKNAWAERKWTKVEPRRKTFRKNSSRVVAIKRDIL